MTTYAATLHEYHNSFGIGAEATLTLLGNSWVATFMPTDNNKVMAVLREDAPSSELSKSIYLANLQVFRNEGGTYLDFDEVEFKWAEEQVYAYEAFGKTQVELEEVAFPAEEGWLRYYNVGGYEALIATPTLLNYLNEIFSTLLVRLDYTFLWWD